MNRTAIATAVLATVALLGLAAPAHAKTSPDHDGDHRPCVTYREFNRIDPGDTKTWTREVFDTQGQEGKRRLANGLYNDLAYYGVDLPRLPMRFREVRLYPFCIEGKIHDGLVTVVFDRRGHKVLIAGAITHETSGRQFVGVG